MTPLESPYETLLMTQLHWAGVTPPQRELRFAPPRRWRFDFAWEAVRLAVEIDGGGFVAGRHSRGPGMEKDAEKHANALLRGWRVLRVTPRQVTDGTALDWIRQLLDQENAA